MSILTTPDVDFNKLEDSAINATDYRVMYKKAKFLLSLDCVILIGQTNVEIKANLLSFGINQLKTIGLSCTKPINVFHFYSFHLKQSNQSH